MENTDARRMAVIGIVVGGVVVCRSLASKYYGFKLDPFSTLAVMGGLLFAVYLIGKLRGRR